MKHTASDRVSPSRRPAAAPLAARVGSTTAWSSRARAARPLGHRCISIVARRKAVWPCLADAAYLAARSSRRSIRHHSRQAGVCQRQQTHWVSTRVTHLYIEVMAPGVPQSVRPLATDDSCRTDDNSAMFDLARQSRLVRGDDAERRASNQPEARIRASGRVLVSLRRASEHW